MVLRRTREEGEWRRPHKVDRNDLSTSPNIVLVMKPRRTRLVVACVGDRSDAFQGFGGET
jgi:hypothetical protein